MFFEKKLGLIVAITAVLSGCGGGSSGGGISGGGGGTDPVTPANVAPVATITSDSEFVAYGPQETLLDGSNSTDSDGSIVSYLWSQTDGEPVQMVNNNESQLRFRSAVTITVVLKMILVRSVRCQGNEISCFIEEFSLNPNIKDNIPAMTTPHSLTAGIDKACVLDDSGVTC